jgi:hypothetical protein
MSEANGTGRLTKCCIVNCDSPPYHSPRVASPYCPRCRANIGGWKKKLKRDPGAARRRIENLGRYADRMSYVASPASLKPMQFDNPHAFLKVKR